MRDWFKIIFFLFVLSGGSLTGFSQQFEWLQTIRPGGNEYCWSLDTDPNGNILATGRVKDGSIFGTGAYQQSPPPLGFNETDVFLARYNPQGNLSWVKRHGGYDADWGRCVASDPFFNSIVVGDFCDTAWFDTLQIAGLGNNLNRNIFIVKYDSVGNALWVKAAGHASNDSRAYAVDTDEFGNVYVGGHISGPSNFDGKPFGITGKNLPFIAKFKPTGQCIWVQHINCQYSGEVNGLAYSNGKIYITGGYRGTLTVNTVNYPGNSPSWSDVFLIKTDTSGTYNWVKTHISSFQDQGNSVTTDNDNNVYICGTYANDIFFPTDTLTSGTFSGLAVIANAGVNGFIARYDVNGNFYWAKNVYSKTAIGITGVATTTTGKVYLTGQVRDTFEIDGQEFIYSNTNNSALIAAFQTSGNLLWHKLVGGGINDHAASNTVAVDKWNNVFIGGNYDGPTCMFDALSTPSLNGWDGFVAKLFPAVNPVIQVSDTTLCSFETATWSIEQEGWPITYAWNFTGATPAGSSNDTVSVSYPSTGTYTGNVLITTPTFSGNFNIPSVNIYTDPVVNLGSDTIICNGETVPLDAGPGFLLYNWMDGQTSQVVSANAGTTYSVMVTDVNGCTAHDTLQVSSHNVVVPYLGVDTTICSNQILVLDAGGGFTSYLWNDASQLQTLQADTTGWYWVSVTDFNSCSSIDSIFVVVDSCSSINELPITDWKIYPNPAYDVVYLVSTDGYPVQRVDLYNANGEMVFSETNVVNEIQVSAFAPGIYLLIIYGREKVSSQKILIK